MTSTSWIRPAAPVSRTATSPRAAVRRFHRSLPGYSPTPLVEVTPSAAALGVGRVLVKDESARFDLAAFKFLGASWATFCAVAERTGFTGPDDVDELHKHLVDAELVALVTATDGNHGRAVARMGRLLGLPVRVYVPTVPDVVIDRIRTEGAALSQIDGDYDTAVATAAADAAADPGAILVQDTAWKGYETIPTWIVEGYATLFEELDEQLDGVVPDLVVVPVGVGSLAQAALIHYGAERTRLASVEPTTAACVLASLAAGEAVSVETADTVMNGLNCGTPSDLAWPYLRDRLDAAVAVTDDECATAMADLAAAGVGSGPSGAAAYAGVHALLLGPGAAQRRAALGLDGDSVVVCLSTEGPLSAERS